jgi:DNA-binding NarL/FixJ family response regulator
MFEEYWRLVKVARRKIWNPHSKMSTKRITVLLAEDHPIVREGLLDVLKAEHDIDVVGEAVNGRQAVKLAKKFLPTVVILDIAMPLLNGLEATRQILKFVPDAKVLILSAHTDEAYVEHVIALGGVGYLVKQQTFANVLVEAIREIQKGNRFLSPGISSRFIQRRKKSPEAASLTRATP